MRKDRFFVPTDYVGESLVWRDQRLAHQLKNVLRLDDKREIYLFNGRGQEATVKLIEIKAENLKFQILAVGNLEESVNRVTLYASLLKKDNFELVVQKATEAGVAKIVPLITERIVKQGGKISRWRVIASEASEQSGRLIVPEISEPLLFSEAVRLASDSHDSNIIFDSSGGKPKKASGDVGIFVGPEGGFEADEVALALANGFSSVSLGEFTLRAETAAIIGTFVVAGGWHH